MKFRLSVVPNFFGTAVESETNRQVQNDGAQIELGMLLPWLHGVDFNAEYLDDGDQADYGTIVATPMFR